MSLTVEQLVAIPRVQQAFPADAPGRPSSFRPDGTGSKYVTTSGVPLDGSAPTRPTDGDKRGGPRSGPTAVSTS
jgi:hypothetical protein